MKQAKRMAIYYDFCNKNHALLFCTDLAARGLDFPDVDWVVQMDAPENVATYIHRVGRTARYRSGGKSLLFLLPSELAFIQNLLKSSKLSDLKKVKADPAKMKDVTSQFASFLAENTELKFLAQKAFISYVRSISLQADKEVFQAGALPFDALAKSMGLVGTPKVKLPKAGATAATSLAHKEKNMPHQLRELLAEKKDGGAAKKAAKAARQALANGAQPMSAVDKILSRKNATVFAESRQKLRAADSDADDSEDDMMVVRRRDHELSSDDEDEVALSSDSDDGEGDDDGEPAAAAAASSSSSKAALRAALDKRAQAQGPQIEGKSIEETSDDFLAVARQRVLEQDPDDRAREQERVKAKHLARKIAAKRHLRESQKEGADDDDDDGVVVTLGRPDGEEGSDDDADRQQSDDSEDDDAAMDGSDDDDLEQSDDEAAEEDEEEEEEPAPSKKRKAAASAAAAAPAAKKKSKTESIADQEALALKILGMQ